MPPHDPDKTGASKEAIRKEAGAAGPATLPDGRILSRTGAVMGRPQAEHGAYGMVRDVAAGETPSVPERLVRGVGPSTDEAAPPKARPDHHPGALLPRPGVPFKDSGR